MTDRNDQKRLVQQATDIVRLVGQDVALQARGREFVCLCPFHEDRNPSMYVVPAKQIYHCFVCGAGGDVFSWMMNFHKMSFPQALEHLAEQAGIKLQRTAGWGGTRGDGQPSERDRILKANDLAVELFGRLLAHPEHGRAARSYISDRGITPEMIEAFQIGYAADSWDNLSQAIDAKGWDRQAFQLAGLIARRNRDGSFYDRLRHRLIFPICDGLGRPIAFGGRRLREEDNPKYLNSPETPLFNKSATLYGLHLAKRAIMNTAAAVVVEGYTDVVACHQAGIKNVVATLGTALTVEHVQQLRHYAQQVVLIFDADEAGQKAADRAVEIFLGGAMDVSIAVLPNGLDPADLLKQEDGPRRWQAAVDAAVDALSYQFDRVRQQFEQATTVTGRQQVAETYLQNLAQLGLHRMGVIRRAMVVQRLAELLRLDEQTVLAMLQRLAPAIGPRTPAAAATGSTGGGASLAAGHDPFTGSASLLPGDVALGADAPTIKALALAEREVVGCLLCEPSLFYEPIWQDQALDEALTPSEMMTPQGRRLYELIYNPLCDGQTLTLAQLLGDLAAGGDTSLARLATAAQMHVEQVCQGDREQMTDMLAAAVGAIRRYYREQAYQNARQALNTQAPASEEQLLRQVVEHHRSQPSAIRIARHQRPRGS